jgi:hypothetical protein
MQASSASNERTSLKHEEKAARIARSIGAFQASAGATAATSWQADGVQ